MFINEAKHLQMLLVKQVLALLMREILSGPTKNTLQILACVIIFRLLLKGDN